MDTTLAVAVCAVVTLGCNVAYRIYTGGRVTGSVGQRLNSIEQTLQALQDEIKKLGEILIKLADMRGEIRSLEGRMDRTEDDIRELRHGEGYVLPIFPKQRSEGSR